MAGAGISGNGGDVKIGSTSIAEVKTWTFDKEAATTRYGSNATVSSGVCYKKTVPGTRQGQGTLDCTYVSLTPPDSNSLDVGSGVTLKLYLTSTLFYSVPAVIKTLKFKVDIDTGAYIGFTADYESDGAWTNVVAGEEAPRGMGQAPEGEAPFEQPGNLPSIAAAGPSGLARVAALEDKIAGLEGTLAQILAFVRPPAAQESEPARQAA